MKPNNRLDTLPPEFLHARILLADDETVNLSVLEVMLQRAGYGHFQSVHDPRHVAQTVAEWQPDILLLDLHMPHITGIELLHEIRNVQHATFPIIVLTADITSEAKRKAFQQGANDFLTKPFDMQEVLLRLHNLLRLHFQHQILEREVQERTRELFAAQIETLQRLALAAEYRDCGTGLHTRRVGVLAARIARQLGRCEEEAYLLEQTAPLHDIGKIAIPDALLLKPGPLTPEEFDLMKQHTIIGGKILEDGVSPWIQQAQEIALSHHEYWDGNGYPKRLQGEEIPLTGRIVAVADVFDTLVNIRPYKKAWSKEEALTEMKKRRGTQFDPNILDAFFKLSLP